MSFENLKPTALDLIDKFQKESKSRLGFIDVSKHGSFTPDSNRAAMNILESLVYDKIAIFGAGYNFI